MRFLPFLFTCLPFFAFAQKTSCGLDDFYNPGNKLLEKVDAIYESMTDTQRVAQMIITSTGRLGKPTEEVKNLVKKGYVGGVIFLSGDPVAFKKDIASLNSLSKNPLIYSIDAEPSLFNRRLTGVPQVEVTKNLNSTMEVKETVEVIDSTISSIGFHHNFAPVVDLSPKNEAIGNRSFGSDRDSVLTLAKAFIRETQQDNIVATAKHFPGHGYVSGDTHKKLVYIDGEMKEVDMYAPLIEAGVISIMVAHIAVENNEDYYTNGLPATCSRKIVTDLLRDEMGFEGIIVTDALNMGALNEIDNAPLKTVQAGCDMILMPPNEPKLLADVLSQSKTDKAFASQVEKSIKRIILLKLCLGMEF